MKDFILLFFFFMLLTYKDSRMTTRMCSLDGSKEEVLSSKFQDRWSGARMWEFYPKENSTGRSKFIAKDTNRSSMSSFFSPELALPAYPKIPTEWPETISASSGSAARIAVTGDTEQDADYFRRWRAATPPYLFLRGWNIKFHVVYFLFKRQFLLIFMSIYFHFNILSLNAS